MSDSKISWTTKTWNPTTGCDQVSPGCDHCYALTLAARLQRMGNPRYQNDGNPKTSGPGFKLTLHPDKLDEPLKWRKPARVFVNSMSDLFHDDVPDMFISDVFVRMACAPQHTFQVLTKRPRRMAKLMASPEFVASVQKMLDVGIVPYSQSEEVGRVAWPLPNVWLGTSVEDQKRADLRIPLLLETPAAVRFLSCEPLLGAVDLSGWFCKFLQTEGPHSPNWCRTHDAPMGVVATKCKAAIESHVGLDWIIVGGESGPDYRLMNLDWARDIRDQCIAAGVPFFYKQGSAYKSEMDKKLDGRIWDQMPDERVSA